MSGRLQGRVRRPAPALATGRAFALDRMAELQGGRDASAGGFDLTQVPAVPDSGPRLAISRPGDPAEGEADRAADQVVRGGQVRIAPRPAREAMLARKCRACEEESGGAASQVHRGSEDPATPAEQASSAVAAALDASGSPLDPAARAYFEPHFGADFGDVRIHTGQIAAAASRAVRARAFSLGRHIVFAAGAYAPRTPAGQHLLAHELAHTEQHRAPGSGPAAPAVLARQMDAGPPTQHDAALPGGLPDYPPPPTQAGPTPQQTGPQPQQPPPQPVPPCTQPFQPATSFASLIQLVRAAETRLVAAGITSVPEQIHILRGIYYGTTWSLDFAQEHSTMRNEGFQRFTRQGIDPAQSVPRDVRSLLNCNLFQALQQSQDVVDGNRHIDFGHLIIGLDARSDSQRLQNVQYPVAGGLTSVALGGTGVELVTWLGDLGGGAAQLAYRRVARPSLTAANVFSGSDYGGSINLEGDVAALVAATAGAPTVIPAPDFPAGTSLSSRLTDYLTSTAAGSAWATRATTFLRLYGGTFDATGALTNRAALISAFASKIRIFACNYLVPRVQDGHITLDDGRNAGLGINSAADEVATAFVDALIDAQSGGNRIEATRFPPAGGRGTQACGTQLALAGMANSPLNIFTNPRAILGF